MGVTVAAANQVIAAGTAPDGTERKPMRIAEARITLGVVAARQGDLEGALEYGRRALVGDRHSVPSLVMHGRELAAVLRERFPADRRVNEYIEHLRALAA